MILGFCAHLTFFHCYLALALWSVYELARRRQSPLTLVDRGSWIVNRQDTIHDSRSTIHEIRQLLACHAVPCLFFVVLYLLDIRRMDLGGGPDLPWSAVLGRLLSLGMGGPATSAWFLPMTFSAAAVFALGLRLLARDEANSWLFFAVAVAGSPALFLLGKPAYLFERYFLISFVFFLLLLSYVLAALWRRSRRGAFVAAAAALVMAAGSVRQIVDFERGDRGHFLDALAYIEGETPGDVVSLSGDYDFRVRKFCTFYAPYLHSRKRLVYHAQDALPAGGADWLLVHRMDDSYPLLEQITDMDDNVYQRARDFRIATFGGWSWHVYRNVRGERGCVAPREKHSGRLRNPARQNPSWAAPRLLGEPPWRRRRGRSGPARTARDRRP